MGTRIMQRENSSVGNFIFRLLLYFRLLTHMRRTPDALRTNWLDSVACTACGMLADVDEDRLLWVSFGL
jgi:hypothetical protein